jgi:hypothetical protein
LLPKWNKPQIQVKHNIVIESLKFVRDVFTALTYRCRRRTVDVVLDNVTKMANSDVVIRRILNFLENNSGQIEILKNGKLQELWFPRLPYCVFSNNDVKNEFLDNVNITNAKTKCENLSRDSKSMLVVLKIDYWLKTKLGKFLGLFTVYIELWKKFLSILALVINILIILSYNNDLGSRLEKPSLGDLDDADTRLLFRCIGFLNLFFAVIVVGVHLSQRIPYNILRYKVFEHDAKKLEKDSGLENNDDLVNRTYSRFNHIYGTAMMILKDKTILYHLTYFIFTILGVAYHPVFFAFCLTYLIQRSVTLKDVLMAIYRPRLQILVTLLFSMVVFYWFSIFSYIFINDDYNESLGNS